MEPRQQRRDHQYYEDLVGAVALGAATPEERQALLTHASECPICRPELAELRAAVTALPLMLEEREPSPILRYRIQAMLQHELTTGVPFEEPVVEPDGAAESDVPAFAAAPPVAPATVPEPIRRRRSRAVYIWAAAAILLLAVSAGLALWNLTLLQDRQERDDNVETIDVALEIASPPANTGAELSYLQDRGVFLLSVNNLPELAENEVFQVWLIGDDPAPISVGTFGSETAEVAVAADRAEYAALAVSVEPGPTGSPAPTTTPILVANLREEPVAESWTQATNVASTEAPRGSAGGASRPEATRTERSSTDEEGSGSAPRSNPNSDPADGETSAGGSSGGPSGNDAGGGESGSGTNGEGASGGGSEGGGSGGGTGDGTSGSEAGGGGGGASGGEAPSGGGASGIPVVESAVETVVDAVEVTQVVPTQGPVELPQVVATRVPVEVPVQVPTEIPDLVPTLPIEHVGGGLQRQ